MCSIRTYIKFILASSLILIVSVQSSIQDSLKAVQIAFRHGDRNPMKTYPNDPYNNESFWPEGWGVLTLTGKARLYHLGKYIKERYPGVPIQNVVIYSSNTNRSIVSGMAAMAGFHGQRITILNRIEHMSPATYKVRVIPMDEDKTIMVGQECPKYKMLYDEFFKRSDVMLEFYKQNQEVFDVLNKYSGQKFTYMDLELMMIVDALLIEKSRNLELPDWAEELYESGKLRNIRDSLFHYLSYTEEMKRLRGGYLMKTLVDQMEGIIESLVTDGSEGKSAMTSGSNPKITIHSGHDTTVANWLIMLGVYDGNYGIPYGSVVFMELHESDFDDDEYNIKIYFRNSTDSGPYKLDIPQCPDPCNFEYFKLLMEPLLVENREEECKLEESSGSASGYLNLTVVQFIMVLLNGLILLCFTY